MSRRQYKPIQYAVGSPIYTADNHRPPVRRVFRQINWPGAPVNPCPSICNLRAFDAATGEYLWQVNNLGYLLGRSPDGSLFAVKGERVETGFKRLKNIQISVLGFAITSFASYPFSYRVQQKETFGGVAATNLTTPIHGTRFVKIDTNGALSNVSGVVEYYEGTECTPDYGNTSEAIGPSRRFALGGSEFANIRKCSDDGLIVSNGAIGACQFFDPDRLNSTHRFILYPGPVFPVSGTTSSWVFELNGALVRCPLYGTAAEFQTALSAASGVASCTVTGGPACERPITIDITYTSTSIQISRAIIENGSSNYPAASPYSANLGADPRKIWDLTDFSLKVVGYPKALNGGMGAPGGFTQDNNAVIASGNFGTNIGTPFFPNYRLSWGRFEWVMPIPGSVPNWGYYNRVWTTDLFPSYVQIKPSSGASSIVREISDVKDGKIAVTTTSCRPVGGTDWTTFAVLDDSSGSVIEQGDHGIDVRSSLQFADDGKYFVQGVHRRFSGVDSAEILFVESFDGLIRESDFLESSFTRRIANRIGGTRTTISHSTTENHYSGPSVPVTIWLFGSSRSSGGTATFPFGAYRTDTFRQISALKRWSVSTEWRLQHGTYSGSTWTMSKTTPWYSFTESLATVQTELDGWYGFVSGGGVAVARINALGAIPERATADPALPAWQMITDVTILRDDTFTPNPFSPLAPVDKTSIRLELRNSQQIVTHNLCGMDPQTGLITWQRAVGVNGLANAAAGIYRASHGQLVISTSCDPAIIPDVYPRGAL
jgi:hypothetical protein